MWIITRVGDGDVGEEAVIQKGTFEQEMDKGVEEMPDEDDAELGGRGGVEEMYGCEVRREKKSKGCEKTSNSATIDHKCRLGIHPGCELF